VFYVHPSGTFTSIGSEGGLNCKYLEAAPADLKNRVDYGSGLDEGEFEWCNIFTLFSPLGAKAIGIGTGMANTSTVVNECARRWRRRRDSSSAIHAAANYVNNGKTDWHLPSKDELNELFKYASTAPSGDGRLHRLRTSDGLPRLRPSFSADAYWSSSEASATNAWIQRFTTGIQANYSKTDTHRVRPVRAF
jgi:hypothetical protein